MSEVMHGDRRPGGTWNLHLRLQGEAVWMAV